MESRKREFPNIAVVVSLCIMTACATPHIVPDNSLNTCGVSLVAFVELIVSELDARSPSMGLAVESPIHHRTIIDIVGFAVAPVVVEFVRQ